MKNKSTTYILLAGVLIIWGLVFHNVFAGLDSEEDFSFESPKKKTTPTNDTVNKEVFILLANYRDPFLGTVSRPISNSSVVLNNNVSVKVKKRVKEKVKKEPTDWSFLDYIGVVNNKQTQKQVGLLVISGKEYMVSDKDVINEVSVLKKTKDSIWVEYKSEKKWLRR